jgi:SpoVK/Ycf46/Vps4 family AAA+-type ATPase
MDLRSALRDAAYDSIEEDGPVFSNTSQWTSNDGVIFFPAATSVKELPAGVYSIGMNFGQIFFTKVDIKTEDLIRFSDANSDQVIDEINSFWGKKELFQKFGLPYKRGILLYGPPGSGKTCTIRFLINDLIKLGGIVLQVENVGLFAAGLDVLRKIDREKPIIAIIEDIDSYANDEETTLIGLLDGISNIENIVFLATTNYPEELSGRILNRPSRFDKRFYIGYPNAPSRKMYLEHLAKNMTTKPWNRKISLERWVKDTQGMSVAHLKELFVATVILDNSYDDAIKTIKEMKNQLTSKDFDKYESQELDFLDDLVEEEEDGANEN